MSVLLFPDEVGISGRFAQKERGRNSLCVVARIKAMKQSQAGIASLVLAMTSYVKLFISFTTE